MRCRKFQWYRSRIEPIQAKIQCARSQITRSAAIFATTKPYDATAIDPADPRGVVQQLFGLMLSGQLTLEEFKSMIYIDPKDSDATQAMSPVQELTTL